MKEFKGCDSGGCGKDCKCGEEEKQAKTYKVNLKGVTDNEINEYVDEYVKKMQSFFKGSDCKCSCKKTKDVDDVDDDIRI